MMRCRSGAMPHSAWSGWFSLEDAGVITILLACSVISGCGASLSFIGKNDRSEQSRGERVVVVVRPEADRTGAVALPIVAAAIPVVVEYGVKLIEKEIEREASRYSAEYAGFGVGDAFYAPLDEKRKHQSAPSPKLLFEGITIERHIMVRQPDGQSESHRAMMLSLDVQVAADGRYFRFVPADLEVAYAKCKLRRGDEDVDLDVRVAFQTYWIDGEGAAKTKTFDLPPIIVPGIPVGPSGDWSAEQNAAVRGHLSMIPTTWLPMVPRSGSGDEFGRGTFAVTVNVKEHDDFGKRAKSAAELVEANREHLIENLAKLIMGKPAE